MVRAVRYAGKVYQNEMARAVQQLGYGIRLVRQNGEITGFEMKEYPIRFASASPSVARKSNGRSRNSRRTKDESPA